MQLLSIIVTASSFVVLVIHSVMKYGSLAVGSSYQSVDKRRRCPYCEASLLIHARWCSQCGEKL